jgi:hypothetical protein
MSIMAVLQVQDFPEEVYEKLAEQARINNRSIAQETIVLLKKQFNAIDEPKIRRNELLDQLHENPIVLPKNAQNPAELIREDRNRKAS